MRALRSRISALMSALASSNTAAALTEPDEVEELDVEF